MLSLLKKSIIIVYNGEKDSDLISETRIDYIADLLGTKKNNVIELIQKLRKAIIFA